METETTKECSVCGQAKEYREYLRHLGATYGNVWQDRCIDCVRSVIERILPIVRIPRIDEPLPKKTKECSMCGQVKPIDAYLTRRNARHGDRWDHCKQCMQDALDRIQPLIRSK